MLQEDETGGSPYLSLADAYKLDEVRDVIENNELKWTLNSEKFINYNLLKTSDPN
jgi:hypothetical protein